MHTHQPMTYNVMGSKVNLGSWVKAIKRSFFFTKNAVNRLCFIAVPEDFCTFNSLRLVTFVMGSKINLGHLGSQGSKGNNEILLHFQHMIIPCWLNS